MLGNPCPSCAVNPHPRHYVPVLAHQPFRHRGVSALSFLSTTGAEALYSRHGPTWAGKHLCILAVLLRRLLILNYLGQEPGCSPITPTPQMLAMDIVNPFYMMLPERPLPLCHRCFRPWRPLSPRGAHHRLVLAGIRGQRLNLIYRICASTTQRHPGPALYSARQQHHVGPAASSSCCCSGTPSAWKAPMASPLP